MKTEIKRVVGWSLLVLSIIGVCIGIPVMVGIPFISAVIMFIICAIISVAVNAFIALIKYLID